MYSPPSSEKKQAIRQAAIYLGMVLTVLLAVFVLVLLILGYRFDREAGTLEQGGLVQFNSIPSGASMTIDGTSLSATTSTKATLNPGQHTIMMSRNGYLPWQKTVQVKSGSILWLNYARLIPNDLTVENVASLPGVTSTIASPNQKWIAMTTVENLPEITFVDIGGNTPVPKKVPLPASLYTKPKDASTQRFLLSSWNKSSRYILMEHQYDDTTEWIVIDIDDIEKSKNVTTIFDLPLSSIRFSEDDGKIIFGIMNNDLRRIDIEAETISAPLIRGVAEFSFYDRSTIVYTTTVNPTTKNRSVGYRSENASAPRIIRTFSDDGLVPLHIGIDKYFSQAYVAIAYDTTVEILTGALPRSDSGDPLSLSTVATVSLSSPVTSLTSKTEGRFFIAEHVGAFSVYDLELQRTTTTTLRGGEPAGGLGWIDGYNLWSNAGGTLRFYEFDGANQHNIMPIVVGQEPALTANNRYLYAPTVDEKGAFHLSRVRLVL